MRSSSMTSSDLRNLEEEFRGWSLKGRFIVAFLNEDPDYEPTQPMHFGPAQIINQADFVVYNKVLIKNRFGPHGKSWEGLDKLLESLTPGMEKASACFQIVRFGVPEGWEMERSHLSLPVISEAPNEV